MDVVRSNFEDALPQIEKALKECEFVGISAFLKSREYPNTYEAHTFNFHLFPSSFGQSDVRFVCQASSLEFLCNHKFDFNKFMYEGVPFLNKTQRIELEELCLKNHVKIESALNRGIEQDFLVPQRNKIEKWLKEKNQSSSNTLVLECQGAFSQYLLYQEIRKKFVQLGCEVKEHGKLLVTTRETHDEQIPDYEHEILKIVHQSCGFTRVFDMLVKYKKPLVGHNLLTDILFMYEKFNNSLPDVYDDFKRDIHQLFPYILDTKRIAFALRRHELLRETDLFRKTNLEELHAELSCHKGLYFVLYTPTIVHSNLCQKYVDSHNIHEAGYDAFISGYVFLRMAHILTAKTLGSSMEGPFEFRHYFEQIKKFGNTVNISRATVPFVNLAGDDPKSNKPHWLHISRRRRKQRLTAGQILRELDKFGSLDVKVLDDHRAIVATAHMKISQRILTEFRRHKQFKVREYYPFLDNPKIRTFLWAGGVTTAVVTLLFGGIAAVYYGKRKLGESP